MGNKRRKDRDYPLLGSALKSLRQKEFARFYYVYGKLQIGWSVFCSRNEWNDFHKWIRPQIDLLMTREISYRVFRDKLADYIENMSNPNTHQQLMTLAREAFNSNDDKELYEKGKEIFNLRTIRE